MKIPSFHKKRARPDSWNLRKVLNGTKLILNSESFLVSFRGSHSKKASTFFCKHDIKTGLSIFYFQIIVKNELLFKNGFFLGYLFTMKLGPRKSMRPNWPLQIGPSPKMISDNCMVFFNFMIFVIYIYRSHANWTRGFNLRSYGYFIFACACIESEWLWSEV